MHPGRDCNRCHASNQYPAYTLEGAEFGVQGQANDCFGAGGVTVKITDASRVVYELTTKAGIFFHAEGCRLAVSRPSPLGGWRTRDADPAKHGLLQRVPHGGGGRRRARTHSRPLRESFARSEGPGLDPVRRTRAHREQAERAGAAGPHAATSANAAP
jgi:hypothetical protein